MATSPSILTSAIFLWGSRSLRDITGSSSPSGKKSPLQVNIQSRRLHVSLLIQQLVWNVCSHLLKPPANHRMSLHFSKEPCEEAPCCWPQETVEPWSGTGASVASGLNILYQYSLLWVLIKTSSTKDMKMSLIHWWLLQTVWPSKTHGQYLCCVTTGWCNEEPGPSDHVPWRWRWCWGKRVKGHWENTCFISKC